MSVTAGSDRTSRNIWIASNFAAVAALALLRGYMDRGALRAYGYDLTSFSLLLDQYRESGFVSGIMNNWMDGVGGYTFHWNPMLQPDMVLASLFRPTYEFGISIALLLVLVFASTLFMARSLGVSITLSLQAAWLVFMLIPSRWGDMIVVEPPYIMMLVWLNLIVGLVARSLRSHDPLRGSVLLLSSAIIFAILAFTRPFAVPFILPSLIVQLAALITSRRQLAAAGVSAQSPAACRAIRIAAMVCVAGAALYAASFLPIVMSTSAAAARATQENGLLSAFGGYIIPVIDLPSIDGSGALSLLASLRRWMVQFFIQASPALLTLASLAGAAILIRRGPRLLRDYALGTLVLCAFFIGFALLSQVVSTTIRIQYSVIFALPQLAICATAVVYLLGARGQRMVLGDSEARLATCEQ